MADIDTGEGGILLKTLMECARYPTIKARPALLQEINNAIQILKNVFKKPTQQPTGGSSTNCSCSSCKDEKVHGLLNMFSLNRT